MSTDETIGPNAWSPVDGHQNLFVLMDHATGFKNARNLVSSTDEYFVVTLVKSAYPRDKLQVVRDGVRKFLTRRTG